MRPLCGHYIWLLMYSKHTKWLGWILAYFSAILFWRRLLSVKSILVKFITQSGTTLWMLASFWRLLQELQHKILSRTSLDRLLNKIDSSIISQDGKIEAIHGLPEQQETLSLICKETLETRYAVRRRKVSRLASVNMSSSQMHFAAEWRTHQSSFKMKEWCMCSWFFIMFWLNLVCGLIKEARRLKKADFCF